jgi:hypothetical protein
MLSIKRIIAERLKFMQGRSLAFSYTVGTAYRERGEWLSTKSYEEQYEFGVEALKMFGWTP